MQTGLMSWGSLFLGVHVSPCERTGAKNYDQAKGAAGALGWRLTPDEVAALDSMSDRTTPAIGAPFENW